MNRFLRRSLFLGFGFGLLGLYCTEWAIAEVRTISFPSDKGYGHISAVPASGGLGLAREKLERLVVHDIVLGYAQGKLKVNIPPGYYCVFEPNPSLYLNARTVVGADPHGIDGMKITYSGLEEGEEKVCDNFAKYVAHFNELKMIRTKGSSLTDAGLAPMFPLPLLASLDLSNTYVSKKAVTLACRYPKLQSLILSNVDMHGADFSKLASLTQLYNLSLHNCSLDDDDLKGLAACKQIGNLDISRNPRVTSAALASINKMKKLEVLFVDATSIQVSALPLLKDVPLRILNFDSGKADAATAKKLLAAFPFLKQQKIVFPRLHNGAVTSDEKMLFAPTK